MLHVMADEGDFREDVTDGWLLSCKRSAMACDVLNKKNGRS
jgi:hypothetical protein